MEADALLPKFENEVKGVCPRRVLSVTLINVYRQKILQGVAVYVCSFVTVVEAPHSLRLSEGNRTYAQQNSRDDQPDWTRYRIGHLGHALRSLKLP